MREGRCISLIERLKQGSELSLTTPTHTIMIYSLMIYNKY